jgi:hypothetical protein
MRLSHLALTCVLLAGVAAPPPAFAQSPAPPPPPADPAAAPAPAPSAPPPSAEARKAALKLTDLLGVDRQTEQLIAGMRRQMVENLMRTSAKSPEDAVKIIDELIMPEFNAAAGDLNARVVNVWASNFSVAELNNLITFYQSPLGKKLIATIPAVQQQSVAISQQWGQSAFKAALAKHGDELRARGVKI